MHNFFAKNTYKVEYKFISAITLMFLAFSNITYAGTFTVFDSDIIKSTDGKPVSTQLKFSVPNPGLTTTLRVTSGVSRKEERHEYDKKSKDKHDKDDDNKYPPVANISINGVDIIGPNYFTSTVTEYVGNVSLLADNVITISPENNKGRYLIVELVQLDAANKATSVFGPVTVTRKKDKKLTLDYLFNVRDPEASYELDVLNGDQTVEKSKNTRVSDISVFINDEPIREKEHGDKRADEDDKHNKDKDEHNEHLFSLLDSNKISISYKAKAERYFVTKVIGHDNEAPEISATVTPVQNNSIDSTQLKIAFTCSDKTSGVASCSDAVVIDVTAADQLVTGTATDIAGNSATANVSITTDQTSGEIKATVNGNGIFSAFGPETITRLKGKPDAAKLAFAVSDPSLVYELHVTKGKLLRKRDDDSDDDDQDDDDDKEKHKKSKASVLINGNTIIGRNYFTNGVTEYVGNVSVLDANTISIAPDKKRGSYLKVELVAFAKDGSRFSVFGPITVSRVKHEAFAVDYNFAVRDPSATYEFHLKAGTKPGNYNHESHYARAVVKLNDVLVFSKKDFKKKKNALVKPVTLLDSNDLSIALWRKPNSFVTAEIIGFDDVAPTIKTTITPVATVDGWHNSDVLVSFECNDKTSGIASCSAPVTLSLEGKGQKVAGMAVDIAGNKTTVISTINIDKTAPVISTEQQPQPNANGWNATPVTVNFICSDALSGIKECPSAALINTEGIAQLVSGTASDKAGNTATTSTTINLDTTKPTINYTLTPIPNAAGWNNTDVLISFICADALSGIESCTPPITVVTEGSNQLFTGTAVDKAGNSSTVSVALDIDKTLPIINSLATPAANANGWNNSDVIVDFTCSDNLSGIASCSPSQTVITEGANQLITGTAVDVAGNSANSVVTLNIDKTVPTITASVSPAANATGWHRGDVTVSFTCSDTLSGVATCPTPVNVNSEGAGQVISGTAVDKAGNQATTSVTLNIDKTAPTLSVVSPASGSALSVNPPEIKLSYSDNIAIDPSTLSFSLSGQTLSVQCQSGATSATCTPAAAFTTASVTLDISIKDSVGNATSTQVTYSVDSDADGVPDASDKCSNTPAGEAADSDGCSASQRDTDGDSLNDALDQCPATPAGEVIDNVGCSASQRDSDSDGVTDDKDICPRTATGEAVDSLGCSAAQSDVDGDGIPNEQDAFPTDPKESADLDGDGIGDNSDPDIDGDGVPNNSDAYPNDPDRSKLPVVKINSPATLKTVGSSPIEVKGSVDTAGTLTVNGVVVTPIDGLYTANVALEEGHNTVVTRLVAADGVISTASISVSLDLTPPYVTLESHTDGQSVRTATVAISGLVNDIVRGTVEDSQANVTVNGIQATISNRSYLAKDIPLVEGENIIKIVAADQVGNTEVKNITLIYKPTVGKHLEMAGGQDQSALIKEVLANPISVKVLDDNDQPVANKNVVFRVIQGSGILGIGTDLVGRGVVVKTDALGIASTKYQLGQRSGTGNHKVRARVVGYDDEIIFYASATANIGDKLSVNSGNNQRGGTHQQLPAPFVVSVTDSGTNVVKSARVRFDVMNGGGHFENDSDTITVVTDSDGRASAHYTLGGVTGLDKQNIKAILLDAPEGQTITAGFSASGFTPGDAAATSISGVVVDNQDKPIPGVTIRVDGTTRQAVVDAKGQFTIQNVPVGPVHLIADGSTATVDGEFPSLSYNIVTVSGVNNPLASPIYMVKLNTLNAVYAGLKDVEVTLDEVPGFKLEIPKGSVTFPDGSKEGRISVTAVNANKIPMAPPNGMQPQFIVTIQPTGAKFDPPAPLTLPNVDGHTAGAQVEMFSYDHDLEEFVAIGLGTVSEDGTVIKTNAGIGVIKAGWHCGAQPGGSGCCSGPSECGDFCAEANPGCDAGCSIVPDRVLPEQVDGDCSTATCGGSEPNDSDAPEDDPNDCVNTVCTGPPEPDDGETPANDCQVCQGGSPADAADGGNCDDECGTCKNGGCVIDNPNKQRSEQTAGDCKTALCVGSTDNLNDKPANPYHISCSEFNEGTCSWKINPATDGQSFGSDSCSICQSGQKVQLTGSCQVNVCHTQGECSATGCTSVPDPSKNGQIPGSICYDCSGGAIVRNFDRCPEEECVPDQCNTCVNNVKTPIVPIPDVCLEEDPCLGKSNECNICTVIGKSAVISPRVPAPAQCQNAPDQRIIKIPIDITHYIPLDHADVPAPINEIKVSDFIDSSYNISGVNSLGRIMQMKEVIFTGDGTNAFIGSNRNCTKPSCVGVKPSEFSAQQTYRAKSHVMVEYDTETKRFSITSSIADYEKGGNGHAFEKGTSVVPTKPNFPSGISIETCADPRLGTECQVAHIGGFTPIEGYPSICYRKNTLGDGTCLAPPALQDVEHDVPRSMQIGPAEFNSGNRRQFIGPSSPGKIWIQMSMSNYLPLPKPIFVADVDWVFLIKFDFTDPANPRYELSGSHDRFPLYEVHIGDQLIYGFDGVLAGSNAGSLILPLRGLGQANEIGLDPTTQPPFSGAIQMPIVGGN